MASVLLLTENSTLNSRQWLYAFWDCAPSYLEVQYSVLWICNYLFCLSSQSLNSQPHLFSDKCYVCQFLLQALFQKTIRMFHSFVCQAEVTLKAYSDQAKGKAKAKKIKEQVGNIREKSAIIKRNFRFRFHIRWM